MPAPAPHQAFDDLGVRRTAVTQARLGRRTEQKRKSPLELFSWGADDDELPAEIAAATLVTGSSRDNERETKRRPCGFMRALFGYSRSTCKY